MKDLELMFFKCCEENNLEKVQACLTLEVDVNTVDDHGLTAAYRAAKKGRTEVVRMLAATGKVDWKKGNHYLTSLHVALEHGHSDVVGIIVKQANINFNLKSPLGTTVALSAVRGKSVRCVEILAEQENCDCWNIPDICGVTPLMLALAIDSIVRKKDILQVLLNCPRVDPNHKDQHGNSPLMVAIKRKETAMARLLIQCPRVDLGIKNRNGSSIQRIARLEETRLM